MEPYIEIVATETEAFIKEVLFFHNRKRLRFNKIFGGVGAVLFLACGLAWNSVFLLALTAFYVFWFAWQFIWPGWTAKKMLKKKLKFYNQENPPLTYRFLDEHFELSDIDSWNSVPYDKIESVIRLKSCIVVKIRDKGNISIILDGFQKGSPEELMEFLRSKCPHINPANWNW